MLADMADMNPGLSQSMTAISPFFSAVFDAIFFKQNLKKGEILGMVVVMAGVILLSLRDVIYADKIGSQISNPDKIGLFWPIVFGVLVPAFIALNQLAAKYASIKKGMNTNKLSFNTIILSQFLV